MTNSSPHGDKSDRLSGAIAVAGHWTSAPGLRGWPSAGVIDRFEIIEVDAQQRSLYLPFADCVCSSEGALQVMPIERRSRGSRCARAFNLVSNFTRAEMSQWTMTLTVSS